MDLSTALLKLQEKVISTEDEKVLLYVNEELKRFINVIIKNTFNTEFFASEEANFPEGALKKLIYLFNKYEIDISIPKDKKAQRMYFINWANQVINS